ncbi:MAG: heme ABC exporter ATP-binding protein CcmA [Planctomycetota bacterium]
MTEDRQDNLFADAAITVKSVCKAFGSKIVLDNVGFQVPEATAVCLCGPNGAGKSTLLQTIAGLLHPERGEIYICGQNVKSADRHLRKKLGVILHSTMIYSDLTVLENLLFFAALYGADDRTGRVDELLKQAGLFAYRCEKAARLSRGMAQRLTIARALVHRPSVLLADEPFTNLDAEACGYLTETLEDFTSRGGVLLMATHDIRLGLQCCDSVLVLDGGQLILDSRKCKIDIQQFSRDYLMYARNCR